MVTLSVNVENIADSISKMEKNELETLLLLLSEDGKKLLKRKKDIEECKVKTISREEVFNIKK